MQFRSSGTAKNTLKNNTSEARAVDFHFGSPIENKNVFATAKHIIKNEGYSGLYAYAGLRISLIRVVPNCCVTFVSYELIARWVRGQMNRSTREVQKDES